MTSQIMHAVNYAKSCRFLPDARVAGFLTDADIGHICYGTLHGADRPPEDMFVRFEAVGLDSRGGYDVVKTADGHAYIIVSFAKDAKARGVSMLREHMQINQDFYETRRKDTWGD